MTNNITAVEPSDSISHPCDGNMTQVSNLMDSFNLGTISFNIHVKLNQIHY